ncbi:CRISPR-associated endoribonuclease Cas6 [Clostridium sp. D2Q-14]|uniref:CRISPR-associated endoribonuclease Cas6 n=1 Tax=Anaeromonas gelatinilytica TaxID=2683194 RepID=UPI00193B7B10|nr:CRISPR-associated endoribonuclease Cas6 [Anaeromonas gelatinilytica]MBS4534398.1 CRISPR-associated endoribonuclease Cas6 [Anaeromonas gelatinilytica]
MRFNVELILSNENIPKDKNRMILSLLKHVYESYDEDYYKSLYEDEENKKKSYTFSLYMPNCKFTREEIIIPDKKIVWNFSTDDMNDGIFFYNAVLANRGKAYKIKNNSITINRVNMNKEELITTDYAIYSTMSPIVVREHRGDNKKTWYYSLNEERGKEIFKENLKYQLLDNFGEKRMLDIEEVDFKVLNNKEVKVKHYGIEVLSNICRIKVQAKPYILDYLYKSGAGSRKNAGFGMLDLV